MRWIAIIVFSLTVTCQAGTIYQWRDQNGQWHISDQPPNAPHQVRYYAPSSVSPSLTQPPQTTTQPASQSNVAITLVHPSDGATLRSNPGKVSVKATLAPAASPSDQVQLVMDGNPVQAHPKQTRSASQLTLQWHLSPIDRGTHRFQVRYLESGKVIASSSEHQVYLHRAHVNQPHRTHD
ncbi:hypothetical protein BZG25_11930 [Salinivibrio sp. ML198]|uniref:DUF4124 domain-containing protein n=1 Tax=Salinivibrio sp. ML198 TaxID=1909458 RepID=UPI000988B420|nr:DUF4124 domain-containing protein [Salinivibrio sp. ML198]OOE78576.1 hypothetical protein BZG25_11930 [Salinivibrio sp. ML198]